MSDPPTGARVSAASALLVAACSLLTPSKSTVSTAAFLATGTLASPATSASTTIPATYGVIQPPTLTPLPTLEADALDAFLLSIQTDAECRLPCWWGIRPGATTWQEANQLFLRIRSTIQPAPGNKPGQETFYIQFPLPPSGVGGARI